MVCTVTDCGRPAIIGGLCQSHYIYKREGKPPKKIKNIFARGTDAASRLSERSSKKEGSDCIEWTGLKTAAGYGRMTYNGRHTLAHRLSYATFKGEILDGQLVCHKCDNPACINPSHLFIGTNKTNAEDKVSKGRHPRNGATSCERGHEYTPGSFWACKTKRGTISKKCKLCQKIRRKKVH